MTLRSTCLSLVLVLAAASTVSVAHAQDTEAADLFSSGNEHFQRGMRLRGDRRTTELEAALDDYFASLRHVRSRNVLYNTALVLEALERWDEAFNYWSEYLAVTGLSAEESADGTTHRDALRSHVSVLVVTSDPAGAEVWVDRRDLSARGRTPLEVAVPAGAHTVYFALRGFVETTATATTSLGSSATATVTLAPEPVAVQVLAPDAVLTLDGEPITAGASIPVTPGRHVLRLEVDGRPAIERRFEVPAGGAPMVIDLTSAVASVLPLAPSEAVLHVSSSVDTRTSVDGMPRATGLEVDVTLPPGEHEIEVAPLGAARVSVRRSLLAGDRVRLRVEGHGTSGGLVAGRAVFGPLATLALIGGISFSAAAAAANTDFENGPTPAGADRVDAMNLGADVSWGAALAFGVTALVFCLVDDAGTTATFDEEEEGAE